MFLNCGRQGQEARITLFVVRLFFLVIRLFFLVIRLFFLVVRLILSFKIYLFHTDLSVISACGLTPLKQCHWINHQI